jgi:hypothetical protein
MSSEPLPPEKVRYEEFQEICPDEKHGHHTTLTIRISEDGNTRTVGGDLLNGLEFSGIVLFPQ